MQLHWKPGIGDPTIAGWVTVGAYFIAFLFSVRCAKRLGTGNPTVTTVAQYKLWWFIAGVMLLLGINKQLDLQTLLTEIGKMLAKRQGWYEQRKSIQAVFIGGVACGGFFSLLLVWRTFRNIWNENRLALVGLVTLVSFVLIRAASLHGVDAMLGWKLSGLKINWILELSGIICVWISAVMCSQRIIRARQTATERQHIFL